MAFFIEASSLERTVVSSEMLFVDFVTRGVEKAACKARN